jgi:hypothetical protein
MGEQMSDDEPTPAPDLEQAPGWQVLDSDGNVVDAGEVVQLEAAGNPDDDEEDQQ